MSAFGVRADIRPFSHFATGSADVYGRPRLFPKLDIQKSWTLLIAWLTGHKSGTPTSARRWFPIPQEGARRCQRDRGVLHPRQRRVRFARLAREAEASRPISLSVARKPSGQLPGGFLFHGNEDGGLPIALNAARARAQRRSGSRSPFGAARHRDDEHQNLTRIEHCLTFRVRGNRP